jgi:AcrR family transcriptional regulator
MRENSTARRILRVEREGAEAVSMRRVAEAVGITAMAIYRHFVDRDGLLNALADEGFAELAGRLRGARLAGGVEARLTSLGEIYLEHALEHPRLFELMFLRARAGARRFPRDFKARRSPTANVMAEVVEEGMHNGHFRKDDTWEIVFELGALSHGLIVLYLGGRLGVSRERFRELYRRSFRRYIRGIRK